MIKVVFEIFLINALELCIYANVFSLYLIIKFKNYNSLVKVYIFIKYVYEINCYWLEKL